MADPIDSTVRAPLEAEASQLKEQLEAIDASKFDDNFADSGQVAAEQGEAKTLAANLQDQFDAVEAALRKLDDGTYGQCET
jgi:RNA polymerase-binding transcription factor DksA